MDASAMTDTLSEFLLNLSPADVERERQSPMAKARLESFGLPTHRDMLTIHSVRVAKYWGGVDPLGREEGDALLGAERLDAAYADAERWWADKRAHRARMQELARARRKKARAEAEERALRLKRMPNTTCTADQLQIAMAALNGKK